MIALLFDYDVSLLRFIQQNRIKVLDGPLYWISFVNTLVSISILLLLLLFSFFRKSVLSIFMRLLTVFLTSALMIWLAKFIIVRERPFITHTDIKKLSEAGSASFPSGHTTEAFAMAFAIMMVTNKWQFAVCSYAWAFLVAYSRMALGVHYPSDVLGGMVLGTLIAFILLKISG